MECNYCEKITDCLTNQDTPICRQCADKKGFPLCTKLGKYIEDNTFICNQICNGCIYEEER